MFAKIRNRKIAASILLLALVSIFAVGYFFRWQSLDDPVAKVMYLVPEDETMIEDLVKPERLASQTDIWIETTSDWEQISQLATDGKLFAVIIHHAAVNHVDLEELQDLFQHHRLVVVGIGASTKQWAEMVGMPNFYDEFFDIGCETYICSAIFSTREVMERSRTSYLLNYDERIRILLRSLKNSVWEMQRDYQSSDEARPTLTFTEVEELLRDPNHQ